MINTLSIFIKFKCSREKMQQVLTAIDYKKVGKDTETINLTAYTAKATQYYWRSINCSFNGDNTIHFETHNDAPICEIQNLSALFKDVGITCDWSGDYWVGYCGDLYFKNGECIEEHCYCYEDFDIDIPVGLGVPDNHYWLSFAPEKFGIVRSNRAAINKFLSKFAAKYAEDYRHQLREKQEYPDTLIGLDDPKAYANYSAIRPVILDIPDDDFPF